MGPPPSPVEQREHIVVVVAEHFQNLTFYTLIRINQEYTHNGILTFNTHMSIFYYHTRVSIRGVKIWIKLPVRRDKLALSFSASAGSCDTPKTA